MGPPESCRSNLRLHRNSPYSPRRVTDSELPKHGWAGPFQATSLKLHAKPPLTGTIVAGIRIKRGSVRVLRRATRSPPPALPITPTAKCIGLPWSKSIRSIMYELHKEKPVFSRRPALAYDRGTAGIFSALLRGCLLHRCSGGGYNCNWRESAVGLVRRIFKDLMKSSEPHEAECGREKLRI